MQIRELFIRDIDREITGVIKIGAKNEIDIRNELEEYVVTRELRSNLSKFIDAYKRSLDRPTDKMGVWISGFFGSGKSHFLKVLSYLLSSESFDGKRAFEYIAPQLMDNMMEADLSRIASTKADVILFNIDSKADTDAHNSKDAIVRVLNKVFDDYRGYYGNLPWLSSIESHLDSTGQYVAFKDYYKEKFGVTWEEDRNRVLVRKNRFLETLSAATDYEVEGSTDLLKLLKDSYVLTVESFAEKVRDYILSKGKDHRVIFLVDEIGQYIGDDTNLMLNLQTVTEDLGTMCGGKAWIMVTSQQDIDSVVKVKGNDFSKITGRFDTRLTLSSANVDEVIKERLLKKKPDSAVVDTLKLTYQDKESVLKNLFVFSDRTPTMKKFESVDEFIHIYPFLPYQFNLLQDVFESVRQHGASGKHLAQGERSLLSAFQESAVQYMDKEIGFLIPFHSFYHSIESFLDHDIKIVIQRAKDNVNLNPFDVDVLCLLFMIKYLDAKFPPNLENITTLMIDHTDTDKLELTRKVDSSLRKLKDEALIQKNGDAYIFLTNIEQDINSEIKNIHVEIADVNKKVAERIFEGILNAENRFAFNPEHIFTFNRKLDNDFYGSQKGELLLHIVTPYSNDGDDENRLKMISAQDSSVIFKLPENVGYYEELEEALKIEIYLTRGNATKSSEAEAIRGRKVNEIEERRERALNALKDQLSSATVYVFGQRQEIKEKSFSIRLQEAFGILVGNKYSKISDLTPFIYNKSDLVKVMQEKTQIALEGTMPNKLAFEEIGRHIEDMSKMSMPQTVKTLIDKYSRAPYHWRGEDVKGLLLRMFNNQYISLVSGAEALDRSDIEGVIDLIWKDSNTDIIKVRKKITPPTATVEKARKMVESVFKRTGLSSDADSFIKDVRKIIDDEIKNGKGFPERRGISSLLEEYSRHPYYPGKKVLEEIREILDEIAGVKDEIQFLNKLIEAEDTLIEPYDDLVVIRKFYENQVIYFDEAKKQIDIFEKNRTYVTDEKAIGLVEKMKAIVEMAYPYSKIKELPELRSEFVMIFTDLLSSECDNIRPAIVANEEMTKKYLESVELKADELMRIKHKIQERFKKIMNELDDSNTFVEAIFKKDEAGKAKEQLMQEIDKLKIQPGPGPVPAKTIKKISLTSLAHGLKDIESRDDVEDAVNAFRNFIEKEYGENIVIKLI